MDNMPNSGPATKNSGAVTGFVDMTNDDYHAAPGYSSSHVKTLAAKSPAHYWAEYVNPEREPKQPTKAMLEGTWIHSAVLEPDAFAHDYVMVPEGAPKRPDERSLNAANPSLKTIQARDWWEAFEEANQGKTILGAADYEMCARIRDAVHTHPYASRLFARGMPERSLFAYDNETGELIKCRPDWLNDEASYMVDAKSCVSASSEDFGSTVFKLHYYLQPAWYERVFLSQFGEAPRAWLWLAIEKSPPYAVNVIPHNDEETIQYGRKKVSQLLDTIRRCRDENNWPDYGMTPGGLVVPGYIRQKMARGTL